MPPRLRSVLLGLGGGWLACFVADRAGVMHFSPPPVGGPFTDHCTLIGYPKLQDYFWYVAYPAAALIGAWLALRNWRRTGLAVPSALPGDAQASRPLGWTALAALALGAVWTADPWLNIREIDFVHEGVHLLHVQGWLAGDLPGLTMRTEYGPLYTWSIIWWMRLFGMDMTSFRAYFEAAQALGAALALFSVALLARRPASLLLGGALVLLASVAALTGYGWANGLRFAPALASVVFAARGFEIGGAWTLGAGALASVAWLYSPEFGAAGGASLLFLLVTAGRRRDAWFVGIGWLATLIALAFAMWGTEAFTGLRGFLGAGYGSSRLLGHGALPFPRFGWSLAGPVLDRSRPPWIIGLWLPAAALAAGCGWKLAGAPGGSQMGRRAAVPLALLGYLANLTAVARPYHNLMLGVPAVAALLTVLADGAPWYLPRFGRGAAALMVGLYCLVAPFGGIPGLEQRVRGEPGSARTIPGGGGRLGRLRISPDTENFFRRVVPEIQSRCPPGQRVFAGAMVYQGICFIADRAGMLPFPEPVIALSWADREAVVAALDRYRPPLALIGEMSLDIPYRVDHPEQWRALRQWYDPKVVYPDFMLAVRRATPRRPGFTFGRPGDKSVPGVLRDF